MEVLLARWPKYLDNSNIELFIRDDTSLPDLQFINVVQNVFDPPPFILNILMDWEPLFTAVRLDNIRHRSEKT